MLCTNEGLISTHDAVKIVIDVNERRDLPAWNCRHNHDVRLFFRCFSMIYFCDRFYRIESKNRLSNNVSPLWLGFFPMKEAQKVRSDLTKQVTEISLKDGGKLKGDNCLAKRQGLRCKIPRLFSTRVSGHLCHGKKSSSQTESGLGRNAMSSGVHLLEASGTTEAKESLTWVTAYFLCV